MSRRGRAVSFAAFLLQLWVSASLLLVSQVAAETYTTNKGATGVNFAVCSTETGPNRCNLQTLLSQAPSHSVIVVEDGPIELSGVVDLTSGGRVNLTLQGHGPPTAISVATTSWTWTSGYVIALDFYVSNNFDAGVFHYRANATATLDFNSCHFVAIQPTVAKLFAVTSGQLSFRAPAFEGFGAEGTLFVVSGATLVIQGIPKVPTIYYSTARVVNLKSGTAAFYNVSYYGLTQPAVGPFFYAQDNSVMVLDRVTVVASVLNSVVEARNSFISTGASRVKASSSTVVGNFVLLEGSVMFGKASVKHSQLGGGLVLIDDEESGAASTFDGTISFYNNTVKRSLLSVTRSTVTLDGSRWELNNGEALYGLLLNRGDSARISIANSNATNNDGKTAAFYMGDGDCEDTQLHALDFDGTSKFFNNNLPNYNLTCYGQERLCHYNNENRRFSCITADPCQRDNNCNRNTTTCAYSGVPDVYACACLPNFPNPAGDGISCLPDNRTYIADPAKTDYISDISGCNETTPCNIIALLTNAQYGSTIRTMPGVFKFKGQIKIPSQYLTVKSDSPGTTVFDFSGPETDYWDFDGELAFHNITFTNFQDQWLNVHTKFLYFWSCVISSSYIGQGKALIAGTGVGVSFLNTDVHGLEGGGTLVSLVKGGLEVQIGSDFYGNKVNLFYLDSPVEVGVIAATFSNNSGTLFQIEHIAAPFDADALQIANCLFKNNAHPADQPLISIVGADSLVYKVTFESNPSPLLHLVGGTLNITLASVLNNVAYTSAPVTARGTSVQVTGLQCVGNRAYGGCLHLAGLLDPHPSESHVWDSVFSDNSLVSVSACGSAIYISDSEAHLALYNTHILRNVGELGVICVNNPNNTYMLFNFVNSVIKDNVGRGLVYYEYPSLLPGTKDDTYKDTVLELPTFAGLSTTDKFSFPDHIDIPDQRFNEGNVTSYQVNVTFLNMFGKNIDLPVCHHEACFSIPSGALSATQLICPVNSSYATLVLTISDKDELSTAEETLHTIEWDAANCRGLAVGDWPIKAHGSATITIVSTNFVGSISRTSFGVILALLFLIAAGGVGFLLWWKVCRIRTSEFRQPLLTVDGIMMTDTVTQVLEAAKITIVDPEDVIIQEAIGNGATGVVYCGEWVTQNHMLVAVKQLSTLYLVSDDFSESRKDHLHELVTELSVMVQLSHPNLLPLLGCCVISSADVRLITPYLPMGNLAANLSALDTKQIMPICRQLAFALEYLHLKSLIHRDLKPENILLDQDGEQINVYLADFAMSKQVTTATMTGGVVGTPAYMAPEIIMAGEVGSAADIYAFGVVCIELLTQQRLYAGLRAMAIMQRVGSGQMPPIPPMLLDPSSRPAWLPEPFLLQLQLCLQKKPGDRPSISQICDTLKGVS